MTPTRQGSFRFFRLAGIDVYLHWSWFLVAWFDINHRGNQYSSLAWNVVEYLSLFLIVLMHEFGHALACRQVGGRANQIVLWPLGGVAYVAPPPRPGATLWSIAAGPLVNVLLMPVVIVLAFWSGQAGWEVTRPDLHQFLMTMLYINTGLLVFNLLPIFPLDGGQILRSLLWFVLGRGRSLTVASTLGMIGVVGLFALAFFISSFWLGILAAFILLNCWSALRQARFLSRLADAPRRAGFACPACGQPPPQGVFWGCGQCRMRFDTFETGAECPQCHAQFGATQCFECGALRPIQEWLLPPPAPPAL